MLTLLPYLINSYIVYAKATYLINTYLILVKPNSLFNRLTAYLIPVKSKNIAIFYILYPIAIVLG